jgi:N-acetylglucosaminyl-diphospho-decaprenol L-rhamnosyltransferase
MNRNVHIVIVTHDSGDSIQLCLHHLSRQSVGITSIVLVDSGSADPAYLDTLESKWPLVLVREGDMGFARANNRGFREIQGGGGSLVLFINPDTFLTPDFLELLAPVMDREKQKVCVSGKLLSYDLEGRKATGLIDSAGIYRKGYGRWYDRGQGEVDHGQYDDIASPVALCGALLCFRYDDLESLDGQIFDPDFFLYKEDIELGIRLRRQGWNLRYVPGLVAFHCRGWKKDRRRVPLQLKKMAAKNEIILYRKHPSIYICWAFLKYIIVCLFKV